MKQRQKRENTYSPLSEHNPEGGQHSASLIPPPLQFYSPEEEPSEDTSNLIQRQEAPTSGPPAPDSATSGGETTESATTVTVTDEDRTEYGHLRRRTATAGNVRFANEEEYVTYRNSHFGGRAVYDSIRTIADGEWDRNRVIRRRAGQSSDSTERRKALYRWLRLEYRRMGIDTEAEIVSMMRTGMTPTLQTSVGRLRAALPGLSVGGFVARPKKNNRVGYRLGTLSEHGTGKAIDVTPQRDNPQIPRRAWAEIQRIAGSTVNRSRARWLTNPGDMWQDTQNLNQAFIRNVNSRIEAVKATRREAGADPDTPNPLNEVITNPWLRNRCIDHGLSFFTLSRDLVMAMHGEGLIWGLTFRTTPDLHHFEEP